MPNDDKPTKYMLREVIKEMRAATMEQSQIVHSCKTCFKMIPPGEAHYYIARTGRLHLACHASLIEKLERAERDL